MTKVLYNNLRKQANKMILRTEKVILSTLGVIGVIAQLFLNRSIYFFGQGHLKNRSMFSIRFPFSLYAFKLYAQMRERERERERGRVTERERERDIYIYIY